jgi:hypothetical protein
MRTLAGWLADFLCRPLIPDEREAVLGDLNEHGATNWNIVYELLTLLLHRQSLHWRVWRPWLVLICVVAPTGLFLSEVDHSVSSFIVMQVWTRSHSGAWFQILLSGRQMALAVFCTSAAVAVNCWLSGFAASRLSRPTVWVSGSALFILWFSHSKVLPLDSAVGWYTLTVQMILFVLPCVGGLLIGLKAGPFQFRTAAALFAVVGILTVLTTWTNGWFGSALQSWSAGTILAEPLWSRAWPLLAANLPIAYLVVVAGHNLPQPCRRSPSVQS